jgi:hypothetical protein
MKKETITEVLNELYTLEEYFEYNKTTQGERIGSLINKLQNTLNHEKI